MGGLAPVAQAQIVNGISYDQLPNSGAAVKLQQPLDPLLKKDKADKADKSRNRRDMFDEMAEKPFYRPSEFELFVRQLAGVTKPVLGEKVDEDQQLIRRFGAELVTPAAPGRDGDTVADGPSLVPDDYLVGPGDEVLLSLWGGVEANLRLTVDSLGRIAIPRIGTVAVQGLRYGDLRQAIAKRVAVQFKNFDIAVSLGQVRAIRVYVTGFVQRPGAQSISGLSTVLHALMAAGGPTAVGSFRAIQVRRGKTLVTNFDLYDLLLHGDRGGDLVLRNDDVVHVAAVGAQIGVIGSVNKPAVFETKPGETLADALAMAGGLSTVANRETAVIHRLDARTGQAVRDVNLGKDLKQPLNNGDVLRVLSLADVAAPMLRQNKRVRVDGEVQKPGDYLMPAGSTLTDAVKAAGGLTPEAFLFGTEFSRESVRRSQIDSYERALRDLETDFTRTTAAQRERPSTVGDGQAARNMAQLKLMEKLRGLQPNGRVVLQMGPADTVLPALAVEDGDRIYVPSRPTAINVYGSVLNAGTYAFDNGRSLDFFLSQAGGPARSADKGSIFVLRANGSVVSNRAGRSGWVFGGGLVEATAALPGDTLFVPEDNLRLETSQELKDWSTILYQFGLGAVALKSFR
ncbi:SLBB domain-containing protein [Roseateles sp.]|uniref:SLBB domain-containing protein n=1 Tax=Roseateles sp. TaxID=1971397 RepID=UPI0025F6952C|nr:SLBB domain-containing protein [Roseateles sp.]MBV8033835.1 SLBB domain-containing protein [Roseateles sp.]